MNIKVTCAAAGGMSSAEGERESEIVVDPAATAQVKQQAMTHAAHRSLATGTAILLRFEVASGR